MSTERDYFATVGFPSKIKTIFKKYFKLDITKNFQLVISEKNCKRNLNCLKVN